MRILLVQDHLRIGGTERQTLFLARAFQEKNHAAPILTFRPGGHLVDGESLDDLEIDVLQNFDSRIALWAPRLMKRIGELKPDIILCMGRTANCYAGFIQKRFREIPVVGTLRTGKALFPLHYWSLGVVRAVLVNSNWWKRRMLERGFAEESLHVVHNSLLMNRTEEERVKQRGQLREQYGIDDKTVVFLNVATFRKGKRHKDLLNVFARLKKEHPRLDWRLWLVGDGPEYGRCKHWAAENGLGTRVRFFHFQKDPFPFYAASDIAVSASREDSLPNFLIEAQATSLPVIAYDCRGVMETCNPGETGVVLPPGDATGMLQTIRLFAQDHELRKKFASGAPEFARKRFSRHPQAESVLEFLERIAGKQD